MLYPLTDSQLAAQVLVAQSRERPRHGGLEAREDFTERATFLEVVARGTYARVDRSLRFPSAGGRR